MGILDGFAGGSVRNLPNTPPNPANSAGTDHTLLSWLKTWLNDRTSARDNTLLQMLTGTGQEQKYNTYEAELQRAWSAQQAQINRDYQERLSNTAYQRSVADLRAAGLNPAMAILGGGGFSSASTPTGSQPSGATASGTNSAQAVSMMLSAVAGTAINSTAQAFMNQKNIAAGLADYKKYGEKTSRWYDLFGNKTKRNKVF